MAIFNHIFHVHDPISPVIVRGLGVKLKLLPTSCCLLFQNESPVPRIQCSSVMARSPNSLGYRNSINVSTSFCEEHLPIGYKILSRLTCLGSRFVSRPSWLAIVMTVPSLGYSIFDAPHEMQDVASCFSYFGVHEGTGTLTQSQVDQALLSCLSHLGRYLGHHRVFPWLSVMSEETLKAKQNQALTVPLERPRQTGSSDMCIPCFTSAKRSVEWCEQWIWSHPPSDKLYFREAPCQAVMCLEKKMRAMNLGV